MRAWTIIAVLLLAPSAASAQYYGNLTANQGMPRSTILPPQGGYSNQFGNRSNSPGLYDQNGGFHGNLNGNQFDPDSVSNQFGRYGNPYSPDSVNNRFGLGNPYNPQSQNNPYGQGLRVCGPLGCN